MNGLSIKVDHPMNEMEGIRTFRSIFILFTAMSLFILGCKSKPEYQFTSLDPSSTGIDFQNTILETQQNNILRNEYIYNGGGVAVGDVNNDGLVDVYFSGNIVSNKLYLNKGNLEFEDITTASGTRGRNDWSTGVVMVDINGDNWMDIYVCYSGNSPGEGYNLPVIKENPKRTNQLFINNGCKPGGIPTFTESAKVYGIDAIGTFSNQAYFFDYDRDGDLDMFLLNHANTFYAPFINTKKLRNLRHPYYGNKLFRNDNMHFVEVSDQAGIHGGGLNFGLSAAISDLNLDGWPDIYVTNDYDEQDFFYINNKNGTFREISHMVLGHMSKSSMGSDIADINNDGLADIFVSDMLPEDNIRKKLLRGQDSFERYQLSVDSGFHKQFVRNTLQLNRGIDSDSLPRFSEIGQLAGISNTDWSWSLLLFDINNDGYKDLFVTNGYLKDITNMDNMTRTSEVYRIARERKLQVDYLSLIKDLPVTKMQNYAFENRGGFEFQNNSNQWGLSEKTVSNGAAYADLDNDGDIDIVLNNLDEKATLLRNNLNESKGNNFLRLKLKGSALNTQSIGAKVTIFVGYQKIVNEVYNARGYLSSSEIMAPVGVGGMEKVDSVMIQWPDGSQMILTDVPTNQALEINYKDAAKIGFQDEIPINAVILKDNTLKSGLDFIHREDEFNDFEINQLLPFQLSKLGGKLAVADVNNDGNDDVYLGGASKQSSKLFFGTDNASFIYSGDQPWNTDSEKEDIDAVFFDADNDGDQDLYVVSGGNFFPENRNNYTDRFYLNTGDGSFIKLESAIPNASMAGSCAVAGDYDNDGDLDLFIGGRHSGFNYPLPPESMVLRNETHDGQVKFVNATLEICPEIERVGMVTDAIWSDYDSDNDLDLIIVGEWMKVTFFNNDGGKLKTQNFSELEGSYGWWTAIASEDLDKDGDPDYLLGNVGDNLQIKASNHEPVEMFAYDFNNDGRMDQIISSYVLGNRYPFHSRSELLNQLPSLGKKFNSYESYSTTTLDQLVDQNLAEKTFNLRATTFESCWLENTQGGFILHKLPKVAQMAPINAFASFENEQGGQLDIVAAGNFFPFKPEIGMIDASLGILLGYSNNEVVTVPPDIQSALFLDGDIRDLSLMTFSNGQTGLVVSRNNDNASFYLLEGR